MLKPKTIDIADSNIANLGSELERNVKKAAAETEPAWANAGKEIGLQIWRIEKFKVVSWPKEEYGSFYSGDSYIVLYTYNPPDNKAKIMFNVHFWLGAHTTQDEAGTAAYKTVELDTLLGDEPVQYREVQDHESDLFLGLFPNGLRIMDGGVDSGFRHVEPEKYVPKLFQVKGKKKIRAMQVPLEVDSLNSGDSFVLDHGMSIIVWQGKQSGIFEKNKAAELARSIQNERPKASLKVAREGDGGLEEFWKAFGCDGPQPVKDAAAGGSDADADKAAEEIKLFRISDASGTMEFSEECKGKFSIARLDTNDAFIVDAQTTVYVWIGKSASKAERSQGMQLAVDYLKKNNRPLETTISRVPEGGENESFLACFTDGKRASQVRVTKSQKCACGKFKIRGKCEACDGK